VKAKAWVSCLSKEQNLHNSGIKAVPAQWLPNISDSAFWT